jgi:Kef-type K+ transport system membrane component KefB
MASPYQPSLLRLVHGLTSLGVLGAWVSGVLIYSAYDGRWGKLPFQPPGDWIEWHGQLGLLLLVPAIGLALYSFSLGRQRLGRASNAMPLIALVISLVSGLFMEGEWLEERQLQATVYSLHLMGWLLLSLSLVAHLVGLVHRTGKPVARVGSRRRRLGRVGRGPRPYGLPLIPAVFDVSLGLRSRELHDQ